MVKPSLKKQPSHRRDTTRKTRPHWSQFPPHSTVIAVRVQGIQWLKWLHLKEQNNLTEGTKKNEIWVLGLVEPQVGQTSDGKPRFRIGQTVIGLRCSEYTNWSRAWLDTVAILVNLG